MRANGINYDTGTRPAGRLTRVHFEPTVVRRELQIIARDLNCTAVRITGDDPERMAIAARSAAEEGLEVWLSPFPCELTADEMLPLFAECAELAEGLRRDGAAVRLLTGAELSLFAPGFLPGDDLFERTRLLQHRSPDLPAILAEVPGRINAFLAEATAQVRRRFGGEIGYASLPFEGVDWSLFDCVGVDAYRAEHNERGFGAEIRGLQRHGRPVVITEFGCCSYRGAAARGARGWLILDRSTEPPRLDGAYARDEEEQARYAREVLETLDEEGVDTAFWFTFACYGFPHRAGDPRDDLDLASYGVVRVLEHPGRTYPELNLEPKAVFHALAAAYATSREAR